ncbi:MAG: PHP domain-containing protein [Armatimonadota bacterium]|jgi:predicted metal-dependent phosphoesterase TrpH
MPCSHSATRAAYDLHLHTGWSYDATATAADLLAAAAAAGVRRVAITDHHVVDGLAEAIEAAAGYPDVTLVCGAEITVTASIGSVDMLCLGFTPAAIEALWPIRDAYHQWQRECGAALCAGIRALGFDYTDEQREELLASYRPRTALALQGSTHVANRMQRAWFIERGFIGGEDEYAPLLAAAGERVARPPYPAADVVLPAVRRHGALAVIAHPASYFQRDNRERMELLREELLLDGVECAHPFVAPELTAVYRAWCEEHELISTGGSDLHWPEDVSEGIGTHIGPEHWWPEIEARLPAGAIIHG